MGQDLQPNIYWLHNNNIIKSLNSPFIITLNFITKFLVGTSSVIEI